MDWVRAIADLLRELFAWLRSLPQEIGESLSGIKWEVRVWLVLLAVVFLAYGWATRGKS